MLSGSLYAQTKTMSFRSARLIALLAVVGFARSAGAHFVLVEPSSWRSQDPYGLPEKLGPCGDEAGGTPTGIVKPLVAGQSVKITIDERIFHPGHYRVALSTGDRSTLPAEPIVTPDITDCGSVPIQDPAVFPILVDGALLHTSPFSGPQSFYVKLPDDFTCEKCTLQVIEFMSNHVLNDPGGCFYHHCADVSIRAPSTDDGGSGTVAAPPDLAGETMRSSDCRYSTQAPVADAWALLILVSGFVITYRIRGGS